MGYFVTTQGRGGITLFLVDRRIYKNRWWTTDPDTAMEFELLSAANMQANKLRYKNPDVVSSDIARKISSENMNIEIMNEEHPFSSDALGQD